MKLKFSVFLKSLALSVAVVVTCHGRTWTSSDGLRTFEGTLMAYDAERGLVMVKMNNGRTLRFSQDTLSATDIEYLKTAKPGEPDTPPPAKARPIPEVLPDYNGEKADTSKPVKVFILMGQSNMVGFGSTSGLKAATEKGLYPYLVNDAGEWIIREDVRNVYFNNNGGGPGKLKFNNWLSGGNGSGAGAGKFGPEIGIGHYLGYALDEPVLLLKVCTGNRALGWDLLPPSAEGTGNKGQSYQGNKDDPERKPIKDHPNGWYAGLQYDGDTYCAKNALKSIGGFYPGATKYEVAGFFWWQGAADPGKGSVEHYETNLAHLIRDLRKDFNAPNAKFVCATMGHEKKTAPIAKAQLAVDGESGKYPEFKDNVATFYSNPVSKGGSANGHYGGNAETYLNVGAGMGRLMAELLAK